MPQWSEDPVLIIRKINVASHTLDGTGNGRKLFCGKFSPHFKAGGGVLTDLHNRSLHRWSVFDLSK